MKNTSTNELKLRTAAPVIPDHEVMRCIGRGSYGEVWLARSVTGSLRAVKVVRREDFELERTFVREFDGISKFEPVSRNHPGLVQVLHVGRNDADGFYYYVMELGDDREHGADIDPADYEARTMGTDRTQHHRLTTMECIQHGITLADALAHLHQQGLTHRDIKPSNIIYVNGKPKLADIGLVANAGQNTFVGTEGFVPPEGPGSTAADIFSLGMVLYEMSTGNDRMQFPELPSDLGEERGDPMWRGLNDVVCKACAPAARRRYASAALMADALRGVWQLQFRRRRWAGRLLTLPLTTAAAAFTFLTWRHDGAMPWPAGRFGGGGSVAISRTISVVTSPPGADVLLNGRRAGISPVTLAKVPPGAVEVTLLKHRYRSRTVRIAGDSSDLEPVTLSFYDPPVVNVPWVNSLGMSFIPQQLEHLSRQPVSYQQFRSILSDSMYGDVHTEVVDGVKIPMVRSTMDEAIRFCDLLATEDAKLGFISENHSYRPLRYQTQTDPDADREPRPDLMCFRLVVEKSGEVFIESEPSGADIMQGAQRLGVTPFTIFNLRTGPMALTLRLNGYEDTPVTGEVKSGATLSLKAPLRKSRLPVPGQPWKNSLGMSFVPVEPLKDVLFSRWETRIQDYAAFCAANNRPVPMLDTDKDGKSDMEQQPDHPVTLVTRADAVAFCQWLTEKDRREKWLPASMLYRLPTDAEWSIAADRPDSPQLVTPAERHNNWGNIYPWNTSYGFTTDYPPEKAGPGHPAAANLGDLTALKNKALGDLKPLQINELKELGYDDGVAFTSPVGSCIQAKYDLFDMSGNVWEFVSDDYGGKAALAKYAVTRGASWATPVTKNREQFWTQFRRAVAPAQEADVTTGFRIVAAPVAPE